MRGPGARGSSNPGSDSESDPKSNPTEEALELFSAREAQLGELRPPVLFKRAREGLALASMPACSLRFCTLGHCWRSSFRRPLRCVHTRMRLAATSCHWPDFSLETLHSLLAISNYNLRELARGVQTLTHDYLSLPHLGNIRRIMWTMDHPWMVSREGAPWLDAHREAQRRLRLRGVRNITLRRAMVPGDPIALLIEFADERKYEYHEILTQTGLQKTLTQIRGMHRIPVIIRDPINPDSERQLRELYDAVSIIAAHDTTARGFLILKGESGEENLEELVALLRDHNHWTEVADTAESDRRMEIEGWRGLESPNLKLPGIRWFWSEEESSARIVSVPTTLDITGPIAN
jgi:hypothetical protein